jgi:hypothetical protein
LLLDLLACRHVRLMLASRSDCGGEYCRSVMMLGRLVVLKCTEIKAA